MTTVWAATPIRGRENFEPVTAYINLRELQANLQTDYSELDLQQYGQTVSEMMKLRFERTPPLSSGDMLYLSRPSATAVTVEGAEHLDYGKGDYEVQSIAAGFWARSRNPVTVRAKAVVK